MAKCEHCGREMNTAEGCSFPIAVIDGKDVERIPYGYSDFDPISVKPGDRCPDCAATYGHIHHYGCDTEVCPICHGQFAFCDCNKTELRKTAKRPPKGNLPRSFSSVFKKKHPKFVREYESWYGYHAQTKAPYGYYRSYCWEDGKVEEMDNNFLDEETYKTWLNADRRNATGPCPQGDGFERILDTFQTSYKGPVFIISEFTRDESIAENMLDAPYYKPDGVEDVVQKDFKRNSKKSSTSTTASSKKAKTTTQSKSTSAKSVPKGTAKKSAMNSTAKDGRAASRKSAPKKK